MREIQSVRPSPIAGLWYSDQPEQLAREIDRYLVLEKEELSAGEIVGLMAPHAGYRYSGKTAGQAFGQVKGKHFDVVVILSPYHAFHPAVVLSSMHEAYHTPLGDVPVAQELVDHLADRLAEENIQLIKVANDEEHSLEIELPFLQRALKSDFALLPIMVRSVEPAQAALLAKKISAVLAEKKVFYVASTDLSHFYPQKTAEQLDSFMLDQVRSFQPEAVYEAERRNKGFACGLGAVMTTMYLAKQAGANTVRLLDYSTSGDTTGDRSSVVGYGAAAFIRESSSGDD